LVTDEEDDIKYMSKTKYKRRDEKMGIMNKFKNIMLGTDYDEDEYYDEEEYVEDDYYREERPGRLKDISEWSVIRNDKKTSAPATARSNVVSFSQPSDHELVIANPRMIDDASSICDDIVTGKICVVNLEGIERGQAQRIADFLGGVSYAINGDIERISNDIFVIAPSHVSIRGAIREDLKSGGNLFPSWLSGAFR